MSAKSIIAFQGEPGAYSHLACIEARPEMEPLPCPSFEDAFAAVSEGKADLGMIPIENTLGGRVADIHHLLPESNLYIVDEHYQAVRHCLLAKPGIALEDVQRVKSHPQALAQCRRLIRDLGLEPIPVADTAGAARDLAARDDRQTAAIASSLAGEIYGLRVVRKRIEDRLGNTTRFVLMSRTRADPDPRDVPCMTSFVFQLRSVPAALYKALGGFATNGVNITKLESYIIDSSFTVAQFYAEIEGHPSERHVDHALDELQFFSTRLKIIGIYPRHPLRHTL